MTEIQSKNTNTHETKHTRGLVIFSVVLFLAILISMSANWYFSHYLSTESDSDLWENTENNSRVLGTSTKSPEYLTKFAESLNSSGFVLYGSENDEKTMKQKDLFGQARGIIDFVECDPQVKSANASECMAREIIVYPTWIVNDKKYENYRSLSELELILSENASE